VSIGGSHATTIGKAVDDITHWLRNLTKRRVAKFGKHGRAGCRYDEAADEIDRLRADQQAYDSWAADIKAKIDSCKTEIERLRCHLTAAGIDLTTASVVASKLGNEVDAKMFGRAAYQVMAALKNEGNGHSTGVDVARTDPDSRQYRH
jgi:hypothetical protein